MKIASTPQPAYFVLAFALFASASAIADDQNRQSESASKTGIIFGHSLTLTAGINNELSGHHYVIGKLNVSAAQTFENGFGFKIGGTAKIEHYGDNHADNDHKAYFLIDGITPIGTLSYGAMNKKGASELFYNDLNGMAIDVARYKNDYNSLRWQGNFGSVDYAISTRNVENDDDKEISYGIGYTKDNVEIQLAYDTPADKQKRAWAISAEYTQELDDIKNTYQLSYINQPDNDAKALGIQIKSDLGNGFSFGGHYAHNDVRKREDAYGGFISYKNDDWKLKGKWAYTEKGTQKGSLSAQYTLSDFAPRGTTVYAGYDYKENKPKDTGAYVGAVFGLDKALDLGIAYSETNESGPKDFLRGSSLFFSVKY